MLGVGFCLGPLQHLFYKFIDERYPCRSWRIVLKKVLIDQTIASPVYIAAFFLAGGIIENKTDECIDELKTKFVDIYMVRSAHELLISCIRLIIFSGIFFSYFPSVSDPPKTQTTLIWQKPQLS